MYPAFAGDVFRSDAVGLSWLNSATGVGALVSAGSIALRGRVQGLTLLVFAGMFLFCVATVGFIATDHLWVGVIFAALGGYALNSMTTSIQTLTQSAVDNDMRGRVMGLYSLIWRGTPALGALAVGFCAHLIGIRACFAIAALLCFAALIFALPRFGRAQAAMEHPHD
jgi:MFS family permease